MTIDGRVDEQTWSRNGEHSSNIRRDLTNTGHGTSNRNDVSITKHYQPAVLKHYHLFTV